MRSVYEKVVWEPPLLETPFPKDGRKILFLFFCFFCFRFFFPAEELCVFFVFFGFFVSFSLLYFIAHVSFHHQRES